MDQSTRKPKYKLEAPEGGWGYFVCLGMVLVFVATGAAMHSFGLIFNEFLKNIGVGTSVVAIATSCTSGAMSVGGLFSNTLLRRFGRRRVGVFAATLFCCGTIFQIFAQASIHLFVAAAIHGLCFGIMIPIIFSTFNNYFVRKRALMMSVTQAVIGLVHMGVPILLERLMVEFGFRGCLAIMMAFSGNCIFAMLAMHPIKWHMKRVPITEEEMQEVTSEMSPNKETSENGHQSKPLLIKRKEESPIKSMGSLGRLRDEVNGDSRKSSLPSLTNWTGSGIVTEAVEPQPKKTGKWKLAVEFLDLSLLKDPTYVNIVIGITLAFYADIFFFNFLPLYLFDLNYAQVDVARIMSIGAGADLASRCVLAVVNGFFSIPSRHIFLSGVILSIVARYAFLFVFDFWSVAAVTVVMSFLKTWIHIPMPLVFAEYLPKDRFAAGYGLFISVKGLITIVIGPIAGYIRDKSKSYSMTFQFLNACLMLNALVWLAEIFYKRFWKAPDSEKIPDKRRKTVT